MKNEKGELLLAQIISNVSLYVIFSLEILQGYFINSPLNIMK